MRRPNPTEHQIQKSFFDWWAVSQGNRDWYPLCWATPNGGVRHITTAVRLKAEGVRAGVPDVFIAVPCGAWFGLFLEFKRRTGVVTPAQRFYLDALSKVGYRCEVIRSLDEAIIMVSGYLKHATPI